MAASAILPISFNHQTPARISRRKLLTAALATFVSVVALTFYLYPVSGSTRTPAPSFRSRVHSHRISASSARFEFTAEQELAAVTSFVTALASNAFPLSVDPTVPVAPELVLEFSVTGSKVQTEIAAMQQDVWARHPVVLYGKKYSAASRAVKATLSGLHLTPAPAFIDVDTREDGGIIASIVSRVTGAAKFPVLLIGGKAIATDDLDALKASGELGAILAAAGATVGSSKKVHVRERKQIKVTRTESGVVLGDGKRELTHEELVFRGLHSI